MEMVVILNLKLLNIEGINVLYQQKDIVLLNALISLQVKCTSNKSGLSQKRNTAIEYYD